MLNLGSPTQNPLLPIPVTPGPITYLDIVDHNQTSPISRRSIEVICKSSSTEICQQSK